MTREGGGAVKGGSGSGSVIMCSEVKDGVVQPQELWGRGLTDF